MICDQISALIQLPKTAAGHFIKSDWTIDLEVLDTVFPEIAGVLNNYEDCLRTRKLVDGLLLESGRIIWEEGFPNKFSNNSQFTGSTSKLVSIFEAFKDDPEKNTIETLLRLLPILEFSLGNVYLARTGETPPHLLKDLLQDLVDIIDHRLVFLLQLIVGSHKGVNLRNLLWHGFLDQVNPFFATFVFVMINSIGVTISSDEVIPSRLCPEIDLPEMPFSEDGFTFIEPPILVNFKSRLWNQIIELTTRGETVSSCYLLLSHIENVLRTIYGQLNEVDVTARIGKYYVILDSIFYDYILDESTTPLVIGKINRTHEFDIKKSNKRNRFLEEFPPSLIHYGYDLFHAPGGPRIRDKLSHDEAELTQEQSERLWKVLAYFLIQVVRFHLFGHGPQYQSKPLEYESKFMNNLKLVRKHSIVCSQLCDFFESFKVPETLSQNPLAFNCASTRRLTTKDLKNFFRPLDEKQIVKSMLNILEIFGVALQQFSSSCEMLLELFAERKLRSRRRKSLNHLISCLPTLHRGFISILNVVASAFDQCQRIDDDTAAVDFTATIKLLKQTQQLCESLAKNFAGSTQNFFSANQDTCEFLQLIDERKYLPPLTE